MKKYLKTKGVLIGGAALLMVLITLVSFLSGGRVSFVQNGIAAVTRPVETGIRNLVGGLEQIYDYMLGFDQLEERYRALQIRVAAYEQIARVAAEIAEENARLRELLDLSDGIHREHIIDAYVLSWGASNWASIFTIDRGADFGIEAGDPVMTERRELVGVVREVGRNWATVQTIIDPAVRVGGQMGTGVSAVAEGNFALMQDGMLRLSYIPTGEMPLLNDTITTSGLGGVIPKGLVIGRVAGVGLEDTGISFYAVLTPAAELNRLVQVFIVQNIEIED